MSAQYKNRLFPDFVDTPLDGLALDHMAMLPQAWAQRLTQGHAIKAELTRQMAQTDKQLYALLTRIVETNNPTVIAAYETKITKLEQEKLVLIEKREKKVMTKRTPEQIFELAVKFLSNPWNIWKNG
ncbi:MAG: hypothetical protein ACSHWX_17310, partial [Maritalea sp.]